MSEVDSLAAALEEEPELPALLANASRFACGCGGDVRPLLIASEIRIRRGDYDGASACLDAALTATPVPGVVALIHLLYGNLETLRGRSDAAVQAFGAGLDAAREAAHPDVTSDLLWCLGNAHYRFGRITDANATWQRGLAHDEAAGLTEAASLKRGAIRQASLVNSIRGAPGNVVTRAADGGVMSTAEPTDGTPLERIEAMQTSALRLVSCGRVTDAVRLLDLAIALGDALDVPTTSALTRLIAAAALLESTVGTPPDAEVLAAPYLDAAERVLVAGEMSDVMVRLLYLRAVLLRRAWSSGDPTSRDRFGEVSASARRTLLTLHALAADAVAAAHASAAFWSEQGLERVAAFFVDTSLLFGDARGALAWVEAVKAQALAKLVVKTNRRRAGPDSLEWSEIHDLVGDAHAIGALSV